MNFFKLDVLIFFSLPLFYKSEKYENIRRIHSNFHKENIPIMLNDTVF